MSNRRKPTGLRAALAAKKVRIEHYDIPLVAHDEALAAAQAHKKAEQAAEWAEFQPDDDGKAKKAATAAKAKLDACFYRVSFRGLSEADFEALVNAHPPTEEQGKAGETWNPDTFPYALIEACVIDSDGMTADDWKAELSNADRWPARDSEAFKSTVYSANMREFSEGIPKD